MDTPTMKKPVPAAKSVTPSETSDGADPGDGADEQGGSPRQFVNGFARGLKVIRAFGEDAQRLTLTQVAGRAGLTRAGARRLLLTLEELGYASHIGRLYYLTPKILSLGYAYISSMPLWNFAEPILEKLVGDVGETCAISVLDDTESVYILRIPVRRILAAGSTVGSRLPAHATSMGHVLLGGLSPNQFDAYLTKADLQAYTSRTVTEPDKLHKVIAADRAKGWSWVEGEIEESISGLSVPIKDPRGEVIAALNISFNRPRISQAQIVKQHLPKLQMAAAQMTKSMVLRENRAP